MSPTGAEPCASVGRAIRTRAEQRIDGTKLEEQLAQEGIGNRFAVKVTSTELQEVLVSKEGAKAYFNTMHTFMDPVVLRQSQEPDKYEIKAMVAGIDPNGKPVIYNLPFGVRTVYKLYGRVKLFAHVFTSATSEPLVFLVHRPKADGTYLQFVHIGGSGAVVTKEGTEVALKE